MVYLVSGGWLVPMAVFSKSLLNIYNKIPVGQVLVLLIPELAHRVLYFL